MAWFSQRVAQSVFMLWVVITVVFLSIYMVPGDPVELLLSQDGGTPDQAMIEMVRDQMGLNRPLGQQYREKLWALAHFDLGTSLVDNSSIGQEISQRLPRTLELIAMAGLLSLIIGIPTGVIASQRPGSGFDRVGNLLAGTAQSVPVFVLGSLMVLLLSQKLRLLPAGGFVPFSQAPLDHLKLLLMPAGAISVGLSAVVYRITRASMLDVLPMDFVRTARAKGLPRAHVIRHHVLRNALMPVITVFALQLGGLLAGTVLVETVFNWPGLSGMLVGAVNARDYPTVTGVILVASALFIGLNLLVDLIYGLVDPRVRK